MGRQQATPVDPTQSPGNPTGSKDTLLYWHGAFPASVTFHQLEGLLGLAILMLAQQHRFVTVFFCVDTALHGLVRPLDLSPFPTTYLVSGGSLAL